MAEVELGFGMCRDYKLDTGTRVPLYCVLCLSTLLVAEQRHAASFPYWSVQKQLSKVWLDPNMSESFPRLEEDDI